MRWCSAPSTPIPASPGSRVALDRPVIGLGASAPLHYAGLPALVGNDCIVPADADVANALGAVVGQVRVSAEATVSQPEEGLFRLSLGEDRCATSATRIRRSPRAKPRIRAIVAERARDAGTDTAEIEVATRREASRPSRASACSSKPGWWRRHRGRPRIAG